MCFSFIVRVLDCMGLVDSAGIVDEVDITLDSALTCSALRSHLPRTCIFLHDLLLSDLQSLQPLRCNMIAFLPKIPNYGVHATYRAACTRMQVDQLDRVESCRQGHKAAPWIE